MPRLVALALAFAAAPLSQAAGTYFKLAGLYNQPGDIHVNSVAAFKASLKNNTGVGAALGYKFSLLRVEAELQFLRSGAEPNETSGTLLAGVTRTIGTVKETNGFANAYLDFPSFLGLSPYLGAGLGYARVNVDSLARTRNNTPVLQYSGSDSVFGYQGMLGVQFSLLGRATVHVGYRIIKRQDVAVREVLANAAQTVTLDNNKLFELGVTIGF